MGVISIEEEETRVPFLSIIEDTVRRGHLPASKRALIRTQPCWHPGLRPPASRSVRSKRLLFKPLVYGMCYGSPSRRRKVPLERMVTLRPYLRAPLRSGWPWELLQPRGAGNMSQAGKTSPPREDMPGGAMQISDSEAGKSLLKGMGWSRGCASRRPPGGKSVGTPQPRIQITRERDIREGENWGQTLT